MVRFLMYFEVEPTEFPALFIEKCQRVREVKIFEPSNMKDGVAINRDGRRKSRLGAGRESRLSLDVFSLRCLLGIQVELPGRQWVYVRGEVQLRRVSLRAISTESHRTWNRIKSSEIGPHTYSQLMFDKEVNSITSRKIAFLTNSAGTTGCPYFKKMNLDFLYLS